MNDAQATSVAIDLSLSTEPALGLESGMARFRGTEVSVRRVNLFRENRI